LKEIRPNLSAGKRVMFLGDSEFRAIGFQRHRRHEGWDWQVGVKSDTCSGKVKRLDNPRVRSPLSRAKAAISTTSL